MPLTAQEWITTNVPNWDIQDFFRLTELYARYYHAELSHPPKDVVEAIEEKYPIRYTKEETLMVHGVSERDMLEMQQNAALHGYSLAGWEAVEFLGWIVDNSYMRCNPDGYWIKVGSEKQFSASQLFHLFKKESNG